MGQLAMERYGRVNNQSTSSKFRQDATPEMIKRLFCFEGGKFYWRERPVSDFADERAWKIWNTRYSGIETLITEKSAGYKQVTINRIVYQSHRVAYCWHYGKWPNGQIDHINGDPSDNRIENLRVVSNAENSKNMRKFRNNTSGEVGVYWNNHKKRWLAQITVNGRPKVLGSFIDKDDAISARRAANINYGYHTNHGRA